MKLWVEVYDFKITSIPTYHPFNPIERHVILATEPFNEINIKFKQLN